MILDRLEAEITLGTFEYAKYFPNSPLVSKFKLAPATNGGALGFEDFAWQWYEQTKIEWRNSHIEAMKQRLDGVLIPHFKNKPVSEVSKTDILAFRTGFAQRKGRGTDGRVSAQTINHMMNALRMILRAASEQYGFPNPFVGIKALKVKRVLVEPFTLDEVKLIVDNVRADFKNYYLVRFFTGMRTGEIDGLKWKYVDFERRQILVRETIVKMKTEYTKTDGSQREIDMSEPVHMALKDQFAVTGGGEYVFVNSEGLPLNNNNVTKRVWYPLLRLLNLRSRRPYQTRHTAATLWLASGENPEWIARQMGHTSTEMLFRVYSRFVPNLTRRDGSAFEKLLQQSFQTIQEDS